MPWRKFSKELLLERRCILNPDAEGLVPSIPLFNLIHEQHSKWKAGIRIAHSDVPDSQVRLLLPSCSWLALKLRYTVSHSCYSCRVLS
jgi:hypothetical protein